MPHFDWEWITGLSGGGAVVVALAAARHMPEPRAGSVFYAWVFDTIQDLAKNNDRIGKRRPAAGSPAGKEAAE